MMHDYSQDNIHTVTGVPLPLKLAVYCALADSCSGLTTGGSRYTMTHAEENTCRCGLKTDAGLV